MHNTTVELQGKCRRVFYAKVDIFEPDAEPGDLPIHLAGDVTGVHSGGGALEELTGDDLIEATKNDPTAPERYGCIEQYYSPNPVKTPIRVDLAKVQSCHDAVEAHRTADRALDDHVFESSIVLFGAQATNANQHRHTLRVQEVHTRAPGREEDHDRIVQAHADLVALEQTCEDCCEQLLVTRDAAITFTEPES